ncbi:hypothetical protein ACXY7D_03900 [Sphingomonas melonis]
MAEPDSPTAPATAGAPSSVRSAVGNITGVLAIIGAVAAIVQVWDIFNKNEPDVSAELHSSASFIPDGSRVVLNPEEAAIWNLSKNDAIRHYCDRRTPDGKVNYFKDESNCGKVTSITKKIDRSAQYGDQSVSRSEIDLRNGGSDAATGIKLRASQNGHILVRDQSEKTVLDKDISAGDAVSLPTLNPSESLKVTLDTATASYAASQIVSAPTITYSRGKVSISKYRSVSPFFAGLADALDGIPKLILALIFVGISFVVTISSILIVGTINAIIKGKSISSVFETETSKSKAAAKPS